MADDDRAVNPQVTGAIADTNVKVLGEAPAVAVAVLYETVAHSVALAMTAAEQGQEQMEKIGEAIATEAARKITST